MSDTMTRTKAVAPFKKPPPALDNTRAVCLAYLRQFDKAHFPTLWDVEGQALAQLRATPAGNTIATMVACAIIRAGGPLCHTLGEVMDAIGVDQTGANTAFCACHNGRMMTGTDVARQLERVFAQG